MQQTAKLLTYMTLIILLASQAALAQRRHRTTHARYISVTAYDPKRDTAQDISEAIKQAQRTNKNILLEVGGEWCSWCHRLDNFFQAHPDLVQLRDKNFVTVKINFSEENENKEVLSRYGPIESYPHILVLDADGKLLLSKETGSLESGKTYDLERLTAFLKKWALKSSGPQND